MANFLGDMLCSVVPMQFKFLGEGNDHCVVSIVGSQCVLRIKKVDAAFCKTSSGVDDLRNDILEKCSRDLAFMNFVALQQFGHQLVSPGKLVFLTKTELLSIEQAVSCSREETRCFKILNPYGVAILCPDASSLPWPKVNRIKQSTSSTKLQFSDDFIISSLKGHSKSFLNARSPNSPVDRSKYQFLKRDARGYSEDSYICDSVTLEDNQSIHQCDQIEICNRKFREKFKLVYNFMSNVSSHTSFSNFLKEIVYKIYKWKASHKDFIIEVQVKRILKYLDNTVSRNANNSVKNNVQEIKKILEKLLEKIELGSNVLRNTEDGSFLTRSFAGEQFLNVKNSVKKYELCEKDFTVDSQKNVLNFTHDVFVDSLNTMHLKFFKVFQPRRFCVELKPKQCLLDPIEVNNCTISNQTFWVCRYCLKQYIKVEQGQVSVRSNYCPMDLFSGNLGRMTKAIRELYHCPQNNLRIFQDGVVVDDLSKFRQLIDVIPRVLLYCPYSANDYTSNNMEDTLKCFSENRRVHSCNCAQLRRTRTIATTQKDTNENAVEPQALPARDCNFAGVLPPGSILDMVLNAQKSKISVNEAYYAYEKLVQLLGQEQTDSLLSNVSGLEHVRSEGGVSLTEGLQDFGTYLRLLHECGCSCCVADSTWPFQLPSHLQHDKCIDELSLNAYNDQTSFDCVGYSDRAADTGVVKRCRNVHSANVQQLAAELREFIATLTFKDCSLMLLLSGPYSSEVFMQYNKSPTCKTVHNEAGQELLASYEHSTKYCTGSTTPFWVSLLSGENYLCQVSIIDLVSKSPSKVRRHYRALQRLQSLVASMLKRGQQLPSCVLSVS